MISGTKEGRLTAVRFIYTHHVRLRIQQRRLLRRDIEAAIHFPDRRLPSFKGRTVARKARGRRTLEVVYRVVNDHVVIITAYWVEGGI